MGLYKKEKNKEVKIGKTTVVTHYTAPKPKVKDEKNKNVFGLLFIDQLDMNQITKQSGQVNQSNEYQVHYTSLVYQLTTEEQSLNISIPLCFFNYKQEVSGGSVIFNLQDVSDTSDAVIPIVQAKAAEFMETNFHKEIMKMFPKAEPILAPLQQIHRHPGRMNSFSGTDYDKNPLNPGICFPFNVAPVRTPSFGSIIAHQKGVTEFIHNEYREVSGSIDAEDGITYLHGKSAVHVKGFDYKPATGFLSFFETQVKRFDSYWECDGISKTNLSDSLKSLATLHEQCEFKASLDMVLIDNVSEKTYNYRNNYHNTYTPGQYTPNYANRNKTDISKTEHKKKYGKSRTLLEMMGEGIEKISKSDQDLINEAIAGETITKETIEDVNSMVNISDLSTIEEAEYADILRDEIAEYGLLPSKLAVTSDQKIFEMAAELNLLDIDKKEEPEVKTEGTFDKFKTGDIHKKA